jgi:hypothetical protein
VVRVVCSVTFSGGAGIGGAIACLCVPDAIAETSLRSALETVLACSRVNAAHLGATIANAPTGAVGTAPPRAFDRVALVEAMDRAAATEALARMRRASSLDALPRDFGADVYDLAFVFPGTDPAERGRYRRRGRDAWRDR